MPALTGRAVALREALRDDPGVALTRGERVLMAEWLNRLADQSIAAESIEKAEASHGAD